MTTETYHLGPAPSDEPCAQVGDDDYEERARRECHQYVAAIRIVCGDEPPGAKLKVVRQEHDFGPYLEVAVVFDPGDRTAADYAARCDAQAPTTWAAAGLDAPNDDSPRDALSPPPTAGKRYVGRRNEDGVVSVWVESPDGGRYPLPTRLDLRNHSPDGFNWGYSGSGPAQLALALAADVLGDDARAGRVYQPLKSRLLAGLEGDAWEFSEADLRAAIARVEREKGTGWKL